MGICWESGQLDQTAMNPYYILLIIVGTIALTFMGFLIADYFSRDSVKERERRRRRRDRRKLRKRAKLEMETDAEETSHSET